MLEVTKDIYSVGILNPNMRIFDVIMRTEYGTSYNSYVVKGSKKIALIDGCHETFTDAYVKNIEEIVSLKDINYLVVNHCEPDHTGAFRKILKLIPQVQIYCTAASKIFLSEITQLPLNIHVVQNNELLDLGDKTLQFIVAPFLHWPDSMFTYVKENKTIFTCDFLGAHYCEPLMMDSKITYINSYKKALKEYFDAIFSPFLPYVRQGLDKLKQLDINFACTSHGPWLTKNGLYSYVLEEYTKWSTNTTCKKSIPIIYATSYGYTRGIAECIQKSIKDAESNIECNLYDANQISKDELINLINSSCGFCLGSPTLNKNAVPPITSILMGLDMINNQNKPVLIFGSYGWSGEAQNILIQSATSLNLKPFKNGIHVKFAPNTKNFDTIKTITQEFVQTLIK